MLDKYGKIRRWEERFKSERYFFEKVFKPGMSVLDVGCATGELYHGLKEKFSQVNYTGIDVADNLIKKARQWTDQAEFIVGNILAGNVLGNKEFDITTATGVFQHEPKSRELLDKMLEHTKDGGYAIFDLKVFHTHETLNDINLSYCDHPDPLYFIVFNFSDLMDWLNSLENVSEIEFFGYHSGVNKSVRLPQSVKEEVCSSHILLKKGKHKIGGKPKVNANLPEEFINKYFKK